MDRILITIVLISSLLFWIIRNREDLTYSKLAEILIALYILGSAFPRFQLPLIPIYGDEAFGTFGGTFRLQFWLLLIPIFLWLIITKLDSRFPKIGKKTIIVFAIVLGYIALNPVNEVSKSTNLALSYILLYLLFLYLLTASCSLSTIIKGIYMGAILVVLLNLALSILFPVLHIKAATTIFAEDAAIRTADRIGSVGTFNHPNNQAVFISYIMMFFTACTFLKFRFKKSLLYSVLSFIIIILSGSRSALISCSLGILFMIALYSYRKYRLFSPKIFFKGILPALIVIVILLFFTPIHNLFFNSDMDEMMMARTLHYICGFEIFQMHPFLGVGLNSHLYYLNHYIDIDFNTLLESEEWMGEDFLYSNPIHNIWLIILCELGSIGFIAVIAYIIRYFYLYKKRIKNSLSQYYNIALTTALGIFGCLFVQGNADWSPLTPFMLNISILFIYLASNNDFALYDENEKKRDSNINRL